VAKRESLTSQLDASKVPPSRFQKRKGSIYATPGSRDGHVGREDEEFHRKLEEKVSLNPPTLVQCLTFFWLGMEMM
jgi:hypothetical protein